ncbi:hypothetical protein IFM89_025251 [Coptis chinensis]|uniref:Pentatricopeptide repeat-containing protein n=1 Tax=Coptis chinensis TaxID=261450 RepID=A0A835M4W6_9MAGN|nr:hypothetical protein IFM89_025251 [Coptis chinensis]
MKLYLISNRFKSLTNPKVLLPRLSRALFYTNDTTPLRYDLYDRIDPVRDQSVSIVPVLDQWLKEGRNATKDDLIYIINTLRFYKRFRHALEISQWMTEQRYIPFSALDVAARLDLIAKVHGLEQAEKYFDTISMQFKKFPVYNDLLHSYASAKSIEKAEALMQQMKQLGFARSPASYNVLLNLYSKVGQYDKLETLLEEMKENGVRANKLTMSIQMAAYAANSNIDGMEKILQSMEVNPEIIMDWKSYATAAKGYIKVGLIEKALQMLKSLEKLIVGKQGRVAYDFLLTMYAGASSSKEDLYRIWKLYKSSEKLNNTSFLSMISSLLELDDIDGAEKILKEWESEHTYFDFRVPNLLIAAYCKNGHLEKAEKLINMTIEKGEKPFLSSWDHLATSYVEANQFPKALKALESAFLARWPKWTPNCDTLSACLEYLKQQGDAEKTEEFVRLLGAPGHMSTDDIERLLDYIYIHNAEAEVGMVKEVDDIKSSDNGETVEIANEAT